MITIEEFIPEPIVEPNLQDPTITTEAETVLRFTSALPKTPTGHTGLHHPEEVILLLPDHLLQEAQVVPAEVQGQQEALAEDLPEVVAEEFSNKEKI